MPQVSKIKISRAGNLGKLGKLESKPTDENVWTYVSVSRQQDRDIF
jgi:hypothetical protein